MTIPHSRPRSRFLAPALGAALAVLAAASFSGCLVSFDGYELADAGLSLEDAGGTTGTSFGGSAVAGTTETGGTSAIAGTSDGGGRVGSGGLSGGATSGGGRVGSGGVGGGATNGGGGATNGGGGRVGSGGVGGGATNGGGGGRGGSAGVGGGATNGGGGASNGGGGATNGGGGAGGGAGNPATCPVPLHGAILVEIPKPGGGIYCIDRTEVTNLDYATFLASNPSTVSQATACTGNTSFAPDMDGTNCTQYDPVSKPKVPVSCVDWCDAQAYCAWSGKHLCGKIGGGSNLTTDFANASKSEWYAACSHAGTTVFPYGDAYQGDSCIGADNTATRPTAVPTASCTGGYDGLFDMSGNVSEWEDSCAANTGLSDLCLYRGGSYNDLDKGTVPSLTCNSGPVGSPAKSASKARSTRDKEIGFRCCLDP